MPNEKLMIALLNAQIEQDKKQIQHKQKILDVISRGDNPISIAKYKRFVDDALKLKSDHESQREDLIRKLENMLPKKNHFKVTVVNRPAHQENSFLAKRSDIDMVEQRRLVAQHQAAQKKIKMEKCSDELLGVKVLAIIEIKIEIEKLQLAFSKKNLEMKDKIDRLQSDLDKLYEEMNCLRREEAASFVYEASQQFCQNMGLNSESQDDQQGIRRHRKLVRTIIEEYIDDLLHIEKFYFDEFSFTPIKDKYQKEEEKERANLELLEKFKKHVLNSPALAIQRLALFSDPRPKKYSFDVTLFRKIPAGRLTKVILSKGTNQASINYFRPKSI